MTAPADCAVCCPAGWSPNIDQVPDESCPEHGRVMTPDTVAPVPNTPGTPRRTIRVPDALWTAAAEKAKGQGTDLSTVLRKALERYVKRR